MTTFFCLYFVVALFTSYTSYLIIEGTGMTGDNIISMIEDEEDREFLYQYPGVYKWMMFLSIAFMGLFWPATLIYFLLNKNKFNL